MDLQKEQAALEASMADRGIARYFENTRAAAERGEATASKGVQTALDSGIIAVSEAIRAFLAEAKTGKAGRRHTAIKRLEGLNVDETAFVVLRSLLDGMARDVPLIPLACQVGRTLELEARMNALEVTHAKYVKKLMKDLDQRTNHVGHRRAVLSKVLREKGDKWTPWGERDNLQTGLKLIELSASSTGLFEIRQDNTGTTRTLARSDKTGKKTIAVVSPTRRFKDWLASLDTRFSLMAPDYLPCVIPPKDWTDNTTGGYHTDALAYPPTLVKTSSRLHKDAIKKADLSKVMSAVNAIQRTPWAINQRVLDVALTLAGEGRPVAGLPDMEDVPLPAKPLDMETNEESLKGWKREAAKTYEGNRKVAGRRLGVLRTLRVAEEFAEYPAIYFPHQLDFRGRVYPIPQGLNPQGNDLTKGLLHFAEGDPLDTVKAIHWFKVHGANCFGVDKVDMDDRLAWVHENARQIIQCAEDPLGETWWHEADSPFCFLAWAFEFNDWLQSDIGNATYRSRIAVAMDGSCNGLQHYSAMLRDPRGGAATNLVPSDTPQDIYAEVAKVVMHLLTLPAPAIPTKGKPEEIEKAKAEAVLHAAWGGYNVSRKITKRPVMVLPYGGTQRSCFDYVYEALKEADDHPFTDEELHKASVYLGGIVWQSIGQVVVAARLAMGWLKQVASVVAKENKPIIWTTPSGFPVVQAYPSVKSSQIECYLFGTRFAPVLTVASETEIDARRQVNGIAPNFVHSLDAAALIDTVNRASAAGVTKFAMIHDSYGTTAGHTATLAEELREAFVAMYEENDVLEDFRLDVVPQHLREGIPTAPFVGGLDLQKVKDSTYFFA